MKSILHGATIGDKHTYRDWGLIPQERIDPGNPEPKTEYTDIPGADGYIDDTESLTGEVSYKNRTMRMAFTVIDAISRWSAIYSDIADYLHGRRHRVVLDDDRSYYYEGRLKINEWESNKATATLVIEANVYPYKRELTSSLEPWLWKPFKFRGGIIRRYSNLRVDGERILNIIGRRETVVPSFIVSSDDGTGLTVEFGGVTYSLPDGTSRVLNIRTTEGDNILTFRGNGVVSVDYRGGRL